ncbi:MAG: ABC transporter permease [Microbacterium sp. 71-36]|uniref:carbohydrate ABC transporter permease n=1 Tax=unclassified Microbacterium TaxID=2609290 RepID=UPI00086991E1|nr:MULTISPECIES: sugar ABC transporter permease [unclassified Microbacterium]MBN9211473.1 sugar ABC transporter permease [Microbacterium sp.]ODT41345.1 MAG: ABC transporter permease [Microbacterium sp. SCN 71-17]OJV75190.1 MAG: ABC transporter permease [Microbacterium sp. 71-36]SIR97278.1 multiple sugar transport system permease protein/raffinose/stachyose/melibiose transport system permease protein [Microbacterium sp. RURRCA19A]
MNKVLGDRRAIALLLGPALLVYTLVMLIPVVWSLGYTLFEGNAISGFEFVGTDNLVRLFTDPRVAEALRFTLLYAVIITAGQVLLGYLLALFYVFVLRNRGSVVRTLVFFPVIIPTVAVALMFQKLFEVAPQTGPVNALLNVFGVASIDWFGSPVSAIVVLVIMDLWRSMGFYAVLLYTGLLDIPDDIMESARLDGANGWRMVRSIVLPLSLPVLLSSIIFSINGTLKVFDSIVALTNGGPGTATTPLTLYMFQTSFSYGEYGYGASIALLLTILCLIVTVFIFRSSRRDVTKG